MSVQVKSSAKKRARTAPDGQIGLTANGQRSRAREADHTRGASDWAKIRGTAPDAWAVAVEDYLTGLAARAKPATVKERRSRLGLLRAWAEGRNLTLGALRARDLDAYLAERRAAGLSDRTLRHFAVAAKCFLTDALARRHIPMDPLRGYQIPKAAPADRYVPTADELRRLLQAVADCWDVTQNSGSRFTYDKARAFYASRDLAIISGLIATGCRISEMLGLRVDDWRPDRGEVSFRGTKNGRDHHLPISPLWASAMDQYLKHRPACENPFVFITADGGSFDAAGHCRPIPLTGWDKAWHRYMAFAGLSGFSRHNLRHYAATFIAVEKGDLMTASALLNHKDLKTTKIYAHGTAASLKKAYDQHDPLRSVLVSPYQQKQDDKKRHPGRPKLL